MSMRAGGNSGPGKGSRKGRTRKPVNDGSGGTRAENGRSPQRSDQKPIYVNTRLFTVVHGEAPQGRRTWGFAIGHGSGIVWVNDSSFDVARDHALQKARDMGLTTITVLP